MVAAPIWRLDSTQVLQSSWRAVARFPFRASFYFCFINIVTFSLQRRFLSFTQETELLKNRNVQKPCKTVENVAPLLIEWCTSKVAMISNAKPEAIMRSETQEVTEVCVSDMAI